MTDAIENPAATLVALVHKVAGVRAGDGFVDRVKRSIVGGQLALVKTQAPSGLGVNRITGHGFTSKRILLRSGRSSLHPWACSCLDADAVRPSQTRGSIGLPSVHNLRSALVRAMAKSLSLKRRPSRRSMQSRHKTPAK